MATFYVWKVKIFHWVYYYSTSSTIRVGMVSNGQQWHNKEKTVKGRSSNYVVVTLDTAGGVRHMFHVPEGVKILKIQLEGGQHFFSKLYKRASFVLNNTSIWPKQPSCNLKIFPQNEKKILCKWCTYLRL